MPVDVPGRGDKDKCSRTGLGRLRILRRGSQARSSAHIWPVVRGAASAAVSVTGDAAVRWCNGAYIHRQMSGGRFDSSRLKQAQR